MRTFLLLPGNFERSVCKEFPQLVGYSIFRDEYTPMPELPDVLVYLECLERRVVGQTLDKVRLSSPFLLRSVEPPLTAVEGKTVRGLRRLGKRLVFELDEELFLVLHLMIAGRLHWKARGAKPPGKIG